MTPQSETSASAGVGCAGVSRAGFRSGAVRATVTLMSPVVLARDSVLGSPTAASLAIGTPTVIAPARLVREQAQSSRPWSDTTCWVRPIERTDADVYLLGP